MGLLGWCAGALGIWGEGKKNFITLWLLLKLRISGGSEFCFKIYVEREILRERGCGLGWKDEGRRLVQKRESCLKEGAGWVERAGGLFCKKCVYKRER